MPHRQSMRPGRALLVAIAAVLVVAFVPGQAAADGKHGKRHHGHHGHHGNSCQKGANDTYKELLRCVTLSGVREHQKAFQRIADRNDDPFYPGTRAAGTEGYDNSARYVAYKMWRAGYRVSLDPVEVTFNFPATLHQLTPVAADYETGPFTGSASGRVQGNVTPIDINLTGDRGLDQRLRGGGLRGRQLGRHGGYRAGPARHLLLRHQGVQRVQRGRRGGDHLQPGQHARAFGLIVADAGTRDDGTVAGMPVTHTIPIVGASFADGEALAQAGSTALVEVIPAETRTDYNVIAEKRGKNNDNVVMSGAHLDSVIEGPGINDNGSGSAALLETAEQMAKVKPQNTIRFAWWAAEEQGLVGSADYVEGLSQAERDRIAMYMNYDMVGSPNYIFMVYDADESTFPAPVDIPAGSAAIEDLYEQYYTWVGEPYDDTEFSGRSDYEAFILNDIPSSGLFTGAEEIKTPAQQAIWGGVAGEQFDQCYHLACDTYDNVDLRALRVNSDLIAFAQLTFAYSTESVNGVRGKRVPGKRIRLPAPAGPEGTFAEGDGGHGPSTPGS